MQVEGLAVSKDKGIAANKNQGMAPLESPASSHSNAETVIMLERPQQQVSKPLMRLSNEESLVQHKSGGEQEKFPDIDQSGQG